MFGLHVYYKQGDDFSTLLANSDGVASVALKAWSERLDAKANDLAKLAQLFEKKEIQSTADTHVIAFDGDLSVLKEAVLLGLIEEEEEEEEEEGRS